MNTIPTHFIGKTLSFNTDDVFNQVEANFINEKGDKMRGNLNMNGNKINNVSNPINNDEVVNKEYNDRQIKDFKYDLKNLLDKKDKTIKKEITIIRENIIKNIEIKDKITNQENAITTISNVVKKLENKIKELDKKTNDQNKIIKDFQSKSGKIDTFEI